MTSPAPSRAADDSPLVDVAIDFVDMRTLVDRVQAAFFGPGV